MSKQINSVDFWVEELTHDINPEHFNHHENFIPYMHDEKISSFGNWMWNNGYNVGLVNLQAKVNTYCIPQWISVNEKLPDEDGEYLISMYHRFMIGGIYKKYTGRFVAKYYAEYKEWRIMNDVCTSVTHWMPLPELPKE